MKWFRLAATQGNAQAQFKLGSAYYGGRGVTQDFARAYMWLNIAAEQRSEDAELALYAISKQMASEQIAEAKEMSQKCAASGYRQCGEPTQTVSTPLQRNAERPKTTPPTQEIKKSAKASGTGFFVSNDGYLATNAHVVNSCEALTAIDNARNQFPVQLIRMSKSDDLALLKANTNRDSVAVFRDSGRINQGETVIVYGFPLVDLLALAGNVTTGLVTALAGLRDDVGTMQISAPVQPGNSGGPVVDTGGAVIGIVVSKLRALEIARMTGGDIAQNVNFAIKASALTNLLDASSVKYRRNTPQQEFSVEALTQQMKEYTVKIECY